MKHRVRIAAGTALALLMATAHATASAQTQERAGGEPGHLVQERAGSDAAGDGIAVLLAQADDEETDEEELIRRRAQEAEEPPAANEEAPAPAEEPAPQPEPAPEPQAEEAPPAEAAPAPAEEPAPEPQLDEAPAAQEAPAPAEEPAPAPEPQAEEAPATEEAPGPAAEPEAAPQPQADEAPAQPQEPAAEPVDEAPGAAEPLPDDGPVPEQAPQPPTDGVEPLPGDEAPTPEPAPPSDGGEVSPEEPAPAPREEPAAAPPSEGSEPAPDQAADPREAPLLDSAKEEPATDQPQPSGTETPADAAPPPASDQEAQQLEEPVEIVPLAAEKGQRVQRDEWHRERREGTDLLREIGDRLVIQLNNQIVVRSDDRDRIGHGAEEVYYDELPRGRLRETVVRPNGVQVVTVYDRYGDVVARSRIMPDGREHVLVHAQDRHREDRHGWRDPGADLPPLRLRIPRDQYVLDAGRVREADTYYDFFRQPPVEPIRRLYSIDEVRYSARLRDSVRRVELDTITFEFGSASIAESEVGRLQGIADAMQHLLDDNPGETFLIEGHTDAVGAEAANLALSDRRAEAVAIALSDVFDVPPENLVTQGYGESYLKINTQEPERENRRVVLRRITPLVAPVASTR